jgi:hypothetical protein
MSESTDKTINDTNSNVPRVLLRGNVNYGAYSPFGSLYRATTSVILKNILASSNPIIDCYHYTSGGGITTLDRMNYSSSTSTGTIGFIANFWLTKVSFQGRDVIQINFEHIRTNELSREAYYIVYSSKITDEVIF